MHVYVYVIYVNIFVYIKKIRKFSHRDVGGQFEIVVFSGIYRVSLIPFMAFPILLFKRMVHVHKEIFYVNRN